MGFSHVGWNRCVFMQSVIFIFAPKYQLSFSCNNCLLLAYRYTSGEDNSWKNIIYLSWSVKHMYNDACAFYK